MSKVCNSITELAFNAETVCNLADLDLAQAGVARVADADHDSFLGYASLVGEWVRLEPVARAHGLMKRAAKEAEEKAATMAM